MRHEVFRYSRGDVLRIYALRLVSGGTELWRVTCQPGQSDTEILEETFTSADAAAQYFGEIARTLTAGGWREV